MSERTTILMQLSMSCLYVGNCPKWILKTIIPIIPLKKNRKKRPQLELPQSKKDEHDEPLEYINEDRYPVCMYGEAMSRDGHDNSKNMTKFRCPFKTGKVKECPHDSVCNKTAYGRVVKIPDNLEDALYGPVDYYAKKWKKLYCPVKSKTVSTQGSKI